MTLRYLLAASLVVTSVRANGLLDGYNDPYTTPPTFYGFGGMGNLGGFDGFINDSDPLAPFRSLNLQRSKMECPFNQRGENASLLIGQTTAYLGEIEQGNSKCAKLLNGNTRTYVQDAVQNLFPTAPAPINRQAYLCATFRKIYAEDFDFALDDARRKIMPDDPDYRECVRDGGEILDPDVSEEARVCLDRAFAKKLRDQESMCARDREEATYVQEEEERFRVRKNKEEGLEKSVFELHQGLQGLLSAAKDGVCKDKGKAILGLAIDLGGMVGAASFSGPLGASSALAASLLKGVLDFLVPSESRSLLKEFAADERFRNTACLFHAVQNGALGCDSLEDVDHKIAVEQKRMDALENEKSCARDGLYASFPELQNFRELASLMSELPGKIPEPEKTREQLDSFSKQSLLAFYDGTKEKSGFRAAFGKLDGWLSENYPTDESFNRLAGGNLLGSEVINRVKELRKLFRDAESKPLGSSEQKDAIALLLKKSADFEKNGALSLADVGIGLSKAVSGLAQLIYASNPSVLEELQAMDLEAAGQGELLSLLQSLQAKKSQLKKFASTNDYRDLVMSFQALRRIAVDEFTDRSEALEKDLLSALSGGKPKLGSDPLHFSFLVEGLNTCIRTRTMFMAGDGGDGSLPLIDAPLASVTGEGNTAGLRKFCGVFEGCDVARAGHSGIPLPKPFSGNAAQQNQELRRYQCTLNKDADRVLSSFWKEFTEKGTVCGRNAGQARTLLAQ